jgi:hypothetical protein
VISTYQICPVDFGMTASSSTRRVTWLAEASTSLRAAREVKATNRRDIRHRRRRRRQVNRVNDGVVVVEVDVAAAAVVAVAAVVVDVSDKSR